MLLIQEDIPIIYTKIDQKLFILNFETPEKVM